MNEEQSDESMLRSISAGGEQATQATKLLFDRHRLPLFRFCIRTGLTEADAQDAVQETFVKIYLNAARFRGAAKASTWMYSIARNQCLSMLRKKSPELQFDDEQWAGIDQKLVDSVQSHDCHTQEDLLACVEAGYAAFAKSHPAQAQAIELAYISDWSQADLATYLNRSVQATKAFLHRSRVRLAGHLNHCKELLRQHP